jgi:hypothetical protein
MTPGSVITATTAFGVITIQAGEIIPGSGEKISKTPWGPVTVPIRDRYPRTYLWGHCKRSADLEPRNERFHGSLGIYFPGTGFHWKECDGVARAVVEEAKQSFDTPDEAMEWLKARSQWMPYVYRNDGLAVGWRTVIPYRKQLEVHVWQMLVAGRRPTFLHGASDAAITTTNLRDDRP